MDTRIAMELTMEMRYKIRIIGVTIGGQDQILEGDEGMVTIWPIPFSTFKNKHNSIAYHRVREAVATGVVSLEHTPGKYNPDDILTNTLGTQQHYPIMK